VWLCARRVDDVDDRWLVTGRGVGPSGLPWVMDMVEARADAEVMFLAAARRLGPHHRRGWVSRTDREVGDTQDALAVDELLLSSRGLAERGGGESVDLAQGALRQFAQGAEGIVGEEGRVGAGSRKAEADVIGGVIDGGPGDEEAVVDACEQRAMGAPRQARFQLGQADQDQRQQSPGVSPQGGIWVGGIRRAQPGGVAAHLGHAPRPRGGRGIGRCICVVARIVWSIHIQFRARSVTMVEAIPTILGVLISRFLAESGTVS